MDKGGRPRDPIWAEYECIKIDGKVLAKCKYCGHEFTGKVERMKNHIQKCKHKIQIMVSKLFSIF